MKIYNLDPSNILIHMSDPLTKAIAVIDSSNARIALVVSEKNTLIGTITDGDVRRALLKGHTLDVPVNKIMFSNFRSLPHKASKSDIIKLMQQEGLHQMPLLDKNGVVVKIYVLSELLQPQGRNNTVVIMAGGEGKRLRPLTNVCPKPMLNIAGKPMLEIILEQCIEAGFTKFYFSVNYLKDQIKKHFENGSQWQIQIEYLEEKKAMGTVGALSLLKERPKEPLLILNADVLSRIDFNSLLNFHEEQSSAATICVREHQTKILYGVVKTDDFRVLSMDEKPIINNYINAGIYLLSPEIIDLIPKDCFFDMPQLLNKAIKYNHIVTAFPIHEYWLDIGHPKTLEKASGEWR